MAETKDRILDAAEQLFAEQGFGDTSLRNITALAEVNLAAVNYHFGSKEALLKAIFERRIGPINQERLETLKALEAEAGDEPVELEAILRALIGPPLRMRKHLADKGNRFMQLAARAHTGFDPLVRETFEGLFKEVFQKFLPAFQRALPEMSREILLLKVYFVVGTMVHTLAWRQHVSKIFNVSLHNMTADDLLEHIVQFTAAGMRAPLPPGDEKEGS